MEKTTVYLTTEQKAALTRAAEAEGRSEARLIRDGIDAVTARHRTGEAGAVPAGDVGDRVRAPLLTARPRWIDREAFLDLVERHAADAGLRSELRDLAPGTTEDEPIE